MFCNKCGAQLPDEAKFCNKCGASFADRAPRESQTAKPSPSADAVSAAGTSVGSPTHPKRNKKPMVIGIAAALLVAAVVVTGNLTDWFGHTSKGVWRLTKVYKNDKLTEQYEYDDYGRKVSGKYGIDDDKNYYSVSVNYDSSAGNRVSCKELIEAHVNGRVGDYVEHRYVYELGPNGRKLSSKYWYSNSSNLKEEDMSEDSALTSSFQYSIFDRLVSVDRTDSRNGSRSWQIKRQEYDSNGYMNAYGANKYSVSCSPFGKPEAVVMGDKRYAVEGDENGNIVCATIDGTTYRYEYQFFANPKVWSEYRPSVYMNLAGTHVVSAD